MPTNRCEFAELLFFWQLDPDNLTFDEWETLRLHLHQDPPCDYCYSQMPRNKEILDALVDCLACGK